MPSNISDLFGGQGVATLLVGGPFKTAQVFVGLAAAANVAVIHSGALVANVWTTAMSIAGRGAINWLGMWHLTSTSKAISGRLTIDGVVAWEGVGPTATQTSAGWPIVGSVGTDAANGFASADVVFQPERFSKSLLFEIRSSITETNGIAFGRNYSIHD